MLSRTRMTRILKADFKHKILGCSSRQRFRKYVSRAVQHFRERHVAILLHLVGRAFRGLGSTRFCVSCCDGGRPSQPHPTLANFSVVRYATSTKRGCVRNVGWQLHRSMTCCGRPDIFGLGISRALTSSASWKLVLRISMLTSRYGHAD
jgi:hypothetical protein